MEEAVGSLLREPVGELRLLTQPLRPGERDALIVGPNLYSAKEPLM